MDRDAMDEGPPFTLAGRAYPAADQRAPPTFGGAKPSDITLGGRNMNGAMETAVTQLPSNPPRRSLPRIPMAPLVLGLALVVVVVLGGYGLKVSWRGLFNLELTPPATSPTPSR